MRLLKADEQLPSVRNLATALQINPMTISKAYAQLELEGVLIRKRGVGMLVAQQQQSQEMSAAIESPLLSFIQAARTEKLNNEEIISLVQQYLSIHNQD